MAESVELRDLGPPLTPADPSEDAKTGFSDRQLRLVLLRLGSLSRAEYYDTSLATADVFQLTSVRYMVDKVRGLSSDHAVAILRDALADHLDDVNFPRDEYQLLQRLLEDKDDDYTHSEKPYLSVTDRDLQIRLEAALIRYHLPYPDRKSVV